MTKAEIVAKISNDLGIEKGDVIRIANFAYSLVALARILGN